MEMLWKMQYEQTIGRRKGEERGRGEMEIFSISCYGQGEKLVNQPHSTFATLRRIIVVILKHWGQFITVDFELI